MKFNTDKSVLSEAVNNASKACAAKTAFNALDGVLLHLSGNELTITGYDLEMGIITVITVEGTEDGEIVVDAKLFSDIIRRMPSDKPVKIEVKDEKDVKVSSGKIELHIQGVSGNNFPNIIELSDNVNFFLAESLLKTMLSQTNHAIAQNDNNPALTGVKFEIKENMLYVVSSDGVRLAMCYEKLEFDDLEFIVPHKAVAELIRNLSENDEDSKINIIIDRNQICFKKTSYTIFSRLIEGKFVDYHRIIHFTPLHTVVVNVKDFASALDRAQLLITEKFKSPVISTFIGRGDDAVMNIKCKTNIGSIEEDLTIKYYSDAEPSLDSNGEEISFSIAFNPRFMQDALKNSGCDEVKILFLADYNPIKVVSLNEEGFVFVVVPVRLK